LLVDRGIQAVWQLFSGSRDQQTGSRDDKESTKEKIMFSNLGNRLNEVFKSLSGRGRLTEENIQETLRSVRIALLEADVALPVAKQFVEKIREQAIGEKVLGSLTPGQALIKLVNDELIAALGQATAELNFNITPPAVILVAGLQGSGKTTTTAKLANLIKTRLNKKVMVVSTDVYRPAAIQQLETLAQQIDVEFFPSDTKQNPIKIAKNAVAQAKKQFMDVVLIDTAGRLHIDKEMMKEIQKIHAAVEPIETLFVIDSMIGQDAVNTAKAFDETLPLTGVILTKTDGDARGGAALSVWYTINKPIKFIGTGEKIDAFEPFHPDRIASRILGMGDVVSLAEEVEQKIDQQKAKKLAKKFKKGKGFDLEDFLDQLEQLGKLGGIGKLIGKLPGMGKLPAAVKDQVNDKKFVQMKAMIQSMTPKERHFPNIIKGSRKRRIANGSGTTIQEINRLLKQFTQMQKMMKKMSKKGMGKMMQQMQGMMPPGGFGGF
jgi:signal recognition particle subunit SRP54